MAEHYTTPQGVNLRRWLRREPQPAQIKAGERVIAVVTKSRSCWADVEETILEMGCPSIEALDAKGAVLRTLSLLAEGEANVQAQDKLGKPEDREERLCMRISELLLEAGDRGALRATEGTQHAVSALVQVTQILVDRVASLEGAAAAAAANNGAPIPGSPAEMDATMKAMFMDFAAKKFLGGTPPATPPTNGKA